MTKMIRSGHKDATSQYGAHMGTCFHIPAYGWAQREGGSRIELSAEEYPGMDGPALEAKAVAMVRALSRAAA